MPGTWLLRDHRVSRSTNPSLTLLRPAAMLRSLGRKSGAGSWKVSLYCYCLCVIFAARVRQCVTYKYVIYQGRSRERTRFSKFMANFLHPFCSREFRYDILSTRPNLRLTCGGYKGDARNLCGYVYREVSRVCVCVSMRFIRGEKCLPEVSGFVSVNGYMNISLWSIWIYRN